MPLALAKNKKLPYIKYNAVCMKFILYFQPVLRWFLDKFFLLGCFYAAYIEVEWQNKVTKSIGGIENKGSQKTFQWINLATEQNFCQNLLAKK